MSEFYDLPEHVALRLCRDALRQQPPIGTIHKRWQLTPWIREHEFHPNLPGIIASTYKGRTFHFSRNYRCLDVYNDEQRVEHLGYYVTVWSAKPGWPSSAHAEIPRIVDLLPTLDRLIEAAESLCHHTRAKEVRGTIRGEHDYHCPDCGATFFVDSSD